MLNKIDLPAAEPDRVKQQIEDVIGIPADDAVMISAKTGLNIEGVLEALVTRLPPPKGNANAPLKALLVDSWYDAYLGVVILVRVKDGRLKRGQRIRMMSTGAAHAVEQVGVFSPKMIPTDDLGPGEIGYITAAIKTVADCNVGDTHHRRPRARHRAPARLQALHPRGLVRPLPGGRRRFREAAREPRPAAPRTTPASITSPRPRPRSASASAAASSACCIWRSCRSG